MKFSIRLLAISIAVGFSLAFLMVQARVYGQVTLATVIGRVTDSSGAVIPNCKVTLRNEATNVTLNTATNTVGEYVLPNIVPGNYQLSATANGFSSYIVSHIIVEVGQTVRRNVSLSVGGAETVIHVTSDVPLVQTDTTSVGNVIESKQIQSIPLNGRTNIFGLLALAPGVQAAGTYAKIGGSSFIGGTNETMDGVNNMEMEHSSLSSYDPSLESIQEFKVVDNAGSAEYGPGTQQVIISSKGGTNTFHGSAFYYNTNQALASTNYFSTTKTPYNRNEFGGSLGGPIRHNKLFFFGSFEGLTQQSTTTSVAAMPTANLKNGNFAGLPAVKDPETQTPFANNQIPTDRFDPTAIELLKYYETANLTTAAAGGLGNNYTWNGNSTVSNYRYGGRVDYTINARNTIFVRYNYLQEQTATPGATPLSGGEVYPFHSQSLAVNYTSVISDHIMNLATFGYSLENDKLESQHANFDPSTILPGLPESFPNMGGIPSVGITGFTTVSDEYGSDDHIPAYQASDILTWQKAKHTIKTGFSYFRYQFVNRGSQTPKHGALSFNGRYTGNAFADFLLGDLSSSSTTLLAKLEAAPTNDRFGFFVQDDYLVTPKLTINAGLRYDLPTLFVNKVGGMANYYPNLQKLVVFSGQYDPSQWSTLWPGMPLVDGATIGINTGNYISNDRLQISPRLGIAFRPLGNDRLIVRTAYGFYYNTMPWIYGSYLEANNPPFAGSKTFEPAAGTSPSLLLSNPFPSGSGSTPSGVNIKSLPAKYRYPQTSQWNLTLESQLSGDFAVRATYLGSLRVHSTYGAPINTPTLAPGPIQARRPVPAFGDINMYTNGSTANEQMLQLAATRRFASGLAFSTEFDWTKELDTSTNDYNELTNPQNLRYDRGNEPMIRPVYFRANYVYDLPFGKGRKFFSGTGRTLNSIVGGWETAGIVTAGDGLPYSVNFTSSVQGWTSNRADKVGDPSVKNPTIQRWFNPAAYALPAQFTYGNSGPYSLFGPKYVDWDMSATKSYQILEKYRAQFRADFFNVLNHPSFSNPASNISIPSTVGQIKSTTSSPRAIELALRLDF